MIRKYAIPNDYNIYCALSTGKVPETILRKLFLNRGIIVSPKTTRENLANYFASLMQGYNDYQDISLQHQKLERSEYISSKEISSELNLLDLGNSLNNLKAPYGKYWYIDPDKVADSAKYTRNWAKSKE